MPGIATHNIFGREMIRALPDVIGSDKREHDAFLLGNQGPDPLFYLVVSPLAKRYRSLGSTLHRKKTAELLDALHECFVKPTPPFSPTLGRLASEPHNTTGVQRAFALGFLCHYLLDSTVHPLVYAQQDAICAAGIDGLKGRRAARAVHATIETELDEYTMTSRLGTTVAEFKPHRTALHYDYIDLTETSLRFAMAVRHTYATTIPDSLFKTAVRLNRLGQMMLDSKGAGLRRTFDYLRPTGLASAYVLSLSHNNAPRHHTSFSNNDHVPWPHPSRSDEIFDMSFEELYEQARQKALGVLACYARTDFTYTDCCKLVGGINFLGRIE